jgi:hypothetical protein
MLSSVLGRNVGGDQAYVPMLAIALQESGLVYRRQIDNQGNPISTLARGWWQFEKEGGVKGVCTHSSTSYAIETMCTVMHIPFDYDDIHEALAWNGPIAAYFARALLYTDAAPLPQIGEKQLTWDYYIRNWRPGKPHPEEWPDNYEAALTTVMEA